SEKRFVDVSDKRSWGQMISGVLSEVGIVDRPDSEDDEGPSLVPRAASSAVSQSDIARDADQAQQFPDLPHSDSALDRYVGVIQRGLEVSHPRDTQALKITFTHTYPTIAAGVANGIAQSFIQRNFEKKTESFSNTSSWLEKSTAGLK